MKKAGVIDREGRPGHIDDDRCRELFEKTTVVIPTLNEEEAIAAVLDELEEIGFPRENILVVDGGSTDRTVDIVKSKKVRIIRQEGRGKARAVKTAVEKVHTPIIAFMDGDYTYSPRELCKLLKKIDEGYDYVVGVRIPEKGSQSLIYRIGNRLLTKFFNLLFGTNLKDVLSGMYAGRTDVFRELYYETSSFGVESEILAHMATMNRRIAEVPIIYRRRLGKKKLNIGGGFNIARDMIKLTWRYYPVFLILGISALILVPSVILGAYVAINMFFYNVKYYIKGLIAIIGFLVGIQSLFLSILALFLKRIEMRIQKQLRALDEKIEVLKKRSEKEITSKNSM